MKAILFYLLLLIIFMQTSSAQNDTISINDNLQIVHLQDSIFVHISWVESERYGRFSNNGLLIIRSGEAVMIDTPMSDAQTKVLCDFLNSELQVKVKALIAGHFHNDCIGGLKYLQSKGAKSLASNLTIEKCKKEGLPIPSIGFDKEYDCLFNNEAIECRFFGGGHSFDNITVWLPQQKILFGGCLVKSIDARGLGNLSHAVVDEWDTTIEKVIYAYPEVKIVIPGHGKVGDAKLLSHTISLVKRHKNQNQ